MTLHRYMLNRRLAAATPLNGIVLEIGNGKKRRGIGTGAHVTLDKDPWREPDIVGDARKLNLPDAEFDAVICCETLQYINGETGTALKEIRRVLRRGGVLLASLPWKLKPQPDELWVWLERWDRQRVYDQLTYHGFVIERALPLWPPLRFHTSGWFIHARAV